VYDRAAGRAQNPPPDGVQSEEYPAGRRAASLTCCSQVKKLIAIVSLLLGNMG
jgi:hypothetical protein